MKIKKTVTVTIIVKLEFDDSLLPDNEWRDTFHNIRTVDQLAKHLAYNNVVNACTLSQIDGFADRTDDECTFKLAGINIECQGE